MNHRMNTELVQIELLNYNLQRVGDSRTLLDLDRQAYV